MSGTCVVKELGGKKYRCFFELALSVMGGKWKPIILYHLGQTGVLRFSEMRRGMPEVTDRMLTRQLRELEADGLILRKVYRQVPPRVEYSLTEPGLGLFPILVTMRDWGAGYEKTMGAGSTPAGEVYNADQQPQLHPSYLEGAPK
jgi:DNA-binding HxlR family transcriptional regulator